jgi:hypothetical protein
VNCNNLISQKQMALKAYTGAKRWPDNRSACSSATHVLKCKYKKMRINVTLTSVRITTVAVDKKYVGLLHIPSVRLEPSSTSRQCACAVLYRHL